MAHPTLITENYRAEQAAQHATGTYGLVGAMFAPAIASLLSISQARSLLDYGCGSQRSLLKGLHLPEEVVYEGYDPAVPQYASRPLPAELVVCVDVLEHIEPELLDNVLDDLAQLCDPLGFFTVHSGPAGRVLSDGRNAHLTQQGAAWWAPRLERRFVILAGAPIQRRAGFVVVVRSLQSTSPHVKPARLKQALANLP